MISKKSLVGLLMKGIWRAASLMALILVMCGCATEAGNTLTQVSTIDALLAGAYDGRMTAGELLGYGDLGIGTFDRLEGEMVVLDRTIYQVKADGKVYRPDPGVTTPFAAVCRFTPDLDLRLADTDFRGTRLAIDRAVPNQGVFCAIKIHGRFAWVKARSVPAQTRPYPPLAEVTKNQPLFHMENVSGTIVGFRSPPFVKGVNVPGYHLHFISDDRTSGGHLLDFRLADGSCGLDILNRFYMILPQDGRGTEQVDFTLDRSRELERVEK